MNLPTWTNNKLLVAITTGLFGIVIAIIYASSSGSGNVGNPGKRSEDNVDTPKTTPIDRKAEPTPIVLEKPYWITQGQRVRIEGLSATITAQMITKGEFRSRSTPTKIYTAGIHLDLHSIGTEEESAKRVDVLLGTKEVFLLGQIEYELTLHKVFVEGTERRASISIKVKERD